MANRSLIGRPGSSCSTFYPPTLNTHTNTLNTHTNTHTHQPPSLFFFHPTELWGSDAARRGGCCFLLRRHRSTAPRSDATPLPSSSSHCPLQRGCTALYGRESVGVWRLSGPGPAERVFGLLFGGSVAGVRLCDLTSESEFDLEGFSAACVRLSPDDALFDAVPGENTHLLRCVYVLPTRADVFNVWMEFKLPESSSAAGTKRGLKRGLFQKFMKNLVDFGFKRCEINTHAFCRSWRSRRG